MVPAAAGTNSDGVLGQNHHKAAVLFFLEAGGAQKTRNKK